MLVAEKTDELFAGPRPIETVPSKDNVIRVDFRAPESETTPYPLWKRALILIGATLATWAAIAAIVFGTWYYLIHYA